jgi:hypothetical protein
MLVAGYSKQRRTHKSVSFVSQSICTRTVMPILRIVVDHPDVGIGNAQGFAVHHRRRGAFIAIERVVTVTMGKPIVDPRSLEAIAQLASELDYKENTIEKDKSNVIPFGTRSLFARR